MIPYHQYSIKQTDLFDANDFPAIQLELADLKTASRDIVAGNKTDILLSFLKNHSIKTAWFDKNREFIALLTGGYFKTSHLEALFESGRSHPAFMAGFEEYFEKTLSAY